MVYICDHCHYLFQDAEGIDRCPDCGKETICPAAEQETAEFERQLKEAERDPL